MGFLGGKKGDFSGGKRGILGGKMNKTIALKLALGGEMGFLGGKGKI